MKDSLDKLCDDLWRIHPDDVTRAGYTKRTSLYRQKILEWLENEKEKDNANK